MMYDKIKVLFNHPTYRYIIIGGIGLVICLCLGYIFYQPNGADYQRARESVERIEKQQRESLELNQTVTDSVERVKGLNQQASERIVRAQEYQQRAITRIDESTKRLDEAEAILKRNEQLIRDVEQRHQAQSSNGTTAAQTAQYVGVD